GGTCTLYLQIASESYAVGSYPINLTYNYTNSNANYSISTTVYQHVDLYAGGRTGVYVFNGESFESALLQNSSNVNVMVHDNYGNLYFNSESFVYEYNGRITKRLGIMQPPNTINSLTIDNNSNVIAGTSAGVYYCNLNESSCSLLNDNKGIIPSSSNILGVAYAVNTSNILYITESTNAYSCIESGTYDAPTMNCKKLITGSNPQYYTNSLSAYNGVLYAGVGTSFESYGTLWNPYSVTPTIIAPAYISSVQVNSYGALFGVNRPSIYNESSIYFCMASGTECVAESSGAGRYITGNINATTMDGAGYIYGVGSNINSGDFSVVKNAYGFFESQTPTTNWQPIVATESLAALVTLSSLVILNK
ncbi:MAG: hypothetical protein K2P99_01475, partial [Burkholderiales bacterium]|nr:hypothetical protein [Burkholderiales bacterium]